MFVIGIVTFSDIQEFGSQQELSVVRPFGELPDLSLKTPTCLDRDSSLFLHGKVGII